MSHHPSQVLRQETEDRELSWSEMDLSTASSYQAAPKVDHDVLRLNDLVFFFTGAQSDTHARQQLRDAKRLGDVVVSALIQRAYLCGIVAGRREHNDGQIGPATELPTNFN